MCFGQQLPRDEAEWRRRMLIVQDGAVYLYILEQPSADLGAKERSCAS